MTDNLRGSLFMVLSMAGFAVEDAFLKGAARDMPLGQVLVIMGLIGGAIFAAFALRAGEPPLPRKMLTGVMLMRSFSEVIGRVFYALALALTPISETSAILQATPLVVVLGAAILFKEKVGALRWVLIFGGFIGVLIVIHPGVAGFSGLSLLAVVGLLGFAGRDLATRAAPLTLSNPQLGAAGFLMLGIAGVILLMVQAPPVVPSVPALGLAVGASFFGVIGYGALTKAMRTGEVGVVTPFRYSRLLFALIIGFFAFGERPDHLTLIGSAIIVGCGVILLSHSRRQRR